MQRVIVPRGEKVGVIHWTDHEMPNDMNAHDVTLKCGSRARAVSIRHLAADDRPCKRCARYDGREDAEPRA